MAVMTSTEDLPESPGEFKRRISEPPPLSDELPEKAKSFRRQVSLPEPDGRQKPWGMTKAQKAKLLFHKTRRGSSIDLVDSLRKDAIKENRQAPWLLIAGIVAFNILGKVGDAIGPAMIGTYPVSLLILNASNTHCILTSTSIPFVPWLFIGAMRRFCEDPMYFWAGWNYREACMTMLRNWSPDMAEGFDKAENMFKNNLYAAVAINPGATVCSLAGASRMPPLYFFSLNVGSTVAQLIIMRYVCMKFPDRIDDVLGYIKQYMLLLLAIMVGITVIPAIMSYFKKEDDKKKED